jgi:hypothetical protein
LRDKKSSLASKNTLSDIYYQYRTGITVRPKDYSFYEISTQSERSVQAPYL